MASYSVKTLIQGTTQELSNLLYKAENLQASVAPQGDMTAQDMAILQQLDYVTQSLEALFEFWAKIEQGVDPACQVDCGASLDDMPLKDLANVLRGQPKTKRVETAVQSGVLEEF